MPPSGPGRDEHEGDEAAAQPAVVDVVVVHQEEVSVREVAAGCDVHAHLRIHELHGMSL